MNRKEHHVVPASGRTGWDVRRENASRASGHFPTKQEAVNAARIMSRNQKTEMIIHDRRGTIRRADSHGNDPCPPRDKR